MVKLMGEVALETRHLVDPELLSMLDVFPALTISQETLAETRATVAQLFEQMQPAADPTLAGITMQERQVPGPAGAPDVPVRIYQPAAAVGVVPALLWIHGGGYVLGSAAEDDHQVRTIVAATGCAAVSVDYRLAPEAPSPAAVEDCYAALRWLHDQAGALGVDPARVFKTLVADVDSDLVVAVVPVSGQLDLKALATAVSGKRATMADPKLAERTTGSEWALVEPFVRRV